MYVMSSLDFRLAIYDPKQYKFYILKRNITVNLLNIQSIFVYFSNRLHCACGSLHAQFVLKLQTRTLGIKVNN